MTELEKEFSLGFLRMKRTIVEKEGELLRIIRVEKNMWITRRSLKVDPSQRAYWWINFINDYCEKV